MFIHVFAYLENTELISILYKQHVLIYILQISTTAQMTRVKMVARARMVSKDTRARAQRTTKEIYAKHV